MKSKYVGQSIDGLLIVKSYSKKSDSGNYNSYFSLKCPSCGKIVERARNNVLKGEARCDCSYKLRNHNAGGMSNTRLNRVYRSMLERCENNRCKAFKYYGERGISVCEKWTKSYQSFYEWAMSSGYKQGLTIDRINNDGNYEPTNCRWVDMNTQNKNKRKGR